MKRRKDRKVLRRGLLPLPQPRFYPGTEDRDRVRKSRVWGVNWSGGVVDKLFLWCTGFEMIYRGFVTVFQEVCVFGSINGVVMILYT